jgi:hypothetical protein
MAIVGSSAHAAVDAKRNNLAQEEREAASPREKVRRDHGRGGYNEERPLDSASSSKNVNPHRGLVLDSRRSLSPAVGVAWGFVRGSTGRVAVVLEDTLLLPWAVSTKYAHEESRRLWPHGSAAAGAHPAHLDQGSERWPSPEVSPSWNQTAHGRDWLAFRLLRLGAASKHAQSESPPLTPDVGFA